MDASFRLPAVTATRSHLDPRVVAVVVTGFCAFLNVYAPQAVLPVLTEEFHHGKAYTALTVSVTTLAIAVLSPIVGLVLARVRRHAILRPAMVVLTLAALVAPWSHTLEQLMLCRFVEGACLPAILSITMAFVGEEWSGGQVGKVMSWYVAANVVGGFCGRFFTGVLSEFCGWRMALALIGVLDALGAVAILRSMPDRQPARTSSPPSWKELRAVLVVPGLQRAYSIGFGILFSLVALFTYVTFYLAQAPFSLGPAAIGSIFLVYLVGTVVTPVAGKFLDRIGMQRGLQLAALGVMVGALFTLSHHLALVILGLAIGCSGAFVSQAATSSYTSEQAGAQRSLALSVYLSAYYLGGTVGAVVPGWAWSLGGWPACVASIVLVQGAILLQVRRHT